MTRFASLLLSCSCNLATFPDEFFSGRALARPCCRPPRPIAKLGDSCNLATSLCVILVVLPGSLTRWEWRSYRSRMRISSGISAKCSVPHLEVRTAPAPLPYIHPLTLQENVKHHQNKKLEFPTAPPQRQGTLSNHTDDRQHIHTSTTHPGNIYQSTHAKCVHMAPRLLGGVDGGSDDIHLPLL